MGGGAEPGMNGHLEIECRQEFRQVNDDQLDEIERGETDVQVDVGHATKIGDDAIGSVN
jgi:hypothetical protein